MSKEVEIMEERIYESLGRGKDSRLSLVNLFNDLRKGNALGYRLATRNIKAKYRQSFLGFFWAIFPALATSVIWIFLNSTRIVTMTDTGMPYPVFVITGTLIWQAFALSVMSPLSAVQNNKNILVKVNFPREAVIISGLYETLFSVLISIGIGFIFLLFWGSVPDWHIFLFLPALLFLILLGTGIGLLLLPIGTLYKDIQYGLPSVLQFLMYLSPVVYAQPDFFGLASVLKYNPVAPLINWARSSMVGQTYIPSADVLMMVGGLMLVLLLAGLILQRITMEILIERMGS